MSKGSVQKPLIRFLTLCLIVCLMGGGIALVYQISQGSVPGYASGESVVGEPSLTAAYVDTIFQRVGSPMVSTGKAVEAAAQKQHIDNAFALAVWWVETNDGAAGVGLADNNPGSVRGSVGYPSAYDGYTVYPSFTDAVNYWFSMMKKVYINRGLTTVSTIAGPYVGTSTSNLWAGKVINLMQRYRAEAPPKPTPTPAISSRIANQGRDGVKHDAPVVQAQTARTVKSNTVSAPVTTTNNTTQIIVLLDLILACALAGWGLSMNRRYASEKKLAGLLEKDLPTRIRTGLQDATPHFDAPIITENLGNMGNVFGDFAQTGSLASSDLLTSPSTEELVPAGVSLSGTSTFAFTQTPNTPFDSTEFPLPFSAPQPGSFQFAHATGSGSARSTETGPSSPLRKTRLQPSVTEADFSKWKVPQLVGAGVSAREPLTSSHWNTFQPDSTDSFSPSPVEASTWHVQPQPIGAGSPRSNGLLSRYKEMHSQSGPGQES